MASAYTTYCWRWGVIASLHINRHLSRQMLIRYQIVSEVVRHDVTKHDYYDIVAAGLSSSEQRQLRVALIVGASVLLLQRRWHSVDMNSISLQSTYIVSTSLLPMFKEATDWIMRRFSARCRSMAKIISTSRKGDSRAPRIHMNAVKLPTRRDNQ